VLESGAGAAVVNARHVKLWPGRKTDVGDAAWLGELLDTGCCGAASCPGRPSRAAGPDPLPQAAHPGHTAECQRIHKTLEDASIRLGSVASDVLGVSGRAMLSALVAGERHPQVLAELARGRPRNRLPTAGHLASWAGRCPGTT
jgi:transposase